MICLAHSGLRDEVHSLKREGFWMQQMHVPLRIKTAQMLFGLIAIYKKKKEQHRKDSCLLLINAMFILLYFAHL